MGTATAAGIPSIHPFPARMAPELALRQFNDLRRGSVVLDPMAGSGTTLRYAADRGHLGLGFDVDPLAVLMSRVWTTPIDTTQLRARAADVLVEAFTQPPAANDRGLDDETSQFIDYWFAEEQRVDVARIAAVLRGVEGPTGDALRLALSRIIVTKDRGASLARDVSHSRPHKVRDTNDYDVGKGFSRSVEQLAIRLDRHPPLGGVEIANGDARDLPVEDNSIDAVLTSPPYLNAIDYLRGHRMALVWLGFDIRYLREIRSSSIGTERGLGKDEIQDDAERLAAGMGELEQLGNRERRMVLRYVLDMLAVMTEIHRVLRSGGLATMVVGNSSLRGVYVANDAGIAAAAADVDLELLDRSERPLPASRRYLPPPGQGEQSHLQKRMRSEVVLKFRKR